MTKKAKSPVIDDPIACTVLGCWTAIDRKWRICGRCWHRLPKAIQGALATLRDACAKESEKHPQDSAKLNTPHLLYRLVWGEALRFLNTGVRGKSLPWRVPERSSFEAGPFTRAHEEALGKP